MNMKELFQHRLETATKAYKEASEKRNRYGMRSWLKRIEWCDSELAKLGEW